MALSHAFGSDDAEWLPTTFEFELGYMYEAHPRSVDDDTQFFSSAIGLPDLWIEPVFAYELDLKRDHGTYLNLELGHTFTLIGASEEGDDDVLDFRLSAAQVVRDPYALQAAGVEHLSRDIFGATKAQFWIFRFMAGKIIPRAASRSKRRAFGVLVKYTEVA